MRVEFFFLLKGVGLNSKCPCDARMHNTYIFRNDPDLLVCDTDVLGDIRKCRGKDGQVASVAKHLGGNFITFSVFFIT